MSIESLLRQERASLLKQISELEKSCGAIEDMQWRLNGLHIEYTAFLGKLTRRLGECEATLNNRFPRIHANDTLLENTDD